MDADQIPHPPWCSERRCTAAPAAQTPSVELARSAQAGVGL